MNDSRWDHKRKMQIYHHYSPENLKTHAWWDDFAFMWGSQKIVVWFVHPRMAYHDKIDDIVYRSMKPSPYDKDWLVSATPNYKYLGKNKKRKKVISWSTNGFGGCSDYYDAWRTKTEILCKTSDYKQKASIGIRQYNYCRGVELVVPIEAVNEEGLMKLKEIVINHLKDPTYFQREFGSYVYSSEDWIREGH